MARRLPARVAAKKRAPSVRNDTTLPVLTHILGILTGFIGALIILLVTKDATTKRHARRALNWQLTLLVWYVLSIVLMLVLIGFVLLGVFALLNIIFCIVAAVKASKNQLYEYPLTIRFLSD